MLSVQTNLLAMNASNNFQINSKKNKLIYTSSKRIQGLIFHYLLKRV